MSKREQRIIELLNRYGEAKFGDEWWPGNARNWIGSEGRELEFLLEAPPGHSPGRLPGKSNLISAMLTTQITANAEALDRIAELLREDPRLDNEELIDAFYDIVGMTGRITDPDNEAPDGEDTPRTNTIAECGHRFGGEPSNPPVASGEMVSCSVHGNVRVTWAGDPADEVADAKRALYENILGAVPSQLRDAVDSLLSDLLALYGGDELDEAGTARVIARALGDSETHPAMQAVRDALMPLACRECSAEAQPDGSPPEHFGGCTQEEG